MITTRAGKGSELTFGEMDTNITELRDGVAAMVPKTMNSGIKTGPYGAETYPWHDLLGVLQIYEAEPNTAVRAAYRGGIKAIQCAEGKEASVDFHIPHDYVMGTQIYLHVHWSHINQYVTGGTCTWGFEVMYAKGHNQGAFGVPVTMSVLQNASMVQYQHLVAEGVLSTTGGSGVSLDTSLLEVDGVIQCRLFLDSNDMTVSQGIKPDPFIHFADIHYQSTNVGTKNRAPGFWD